MAWAGYIIAKSSKMTAEKLQAELARTHLSKLSAEQRAKALRDLADDLNSLPADERRRARSSRFWNELFAEMTEEEKAEFIDLTMPTGFKQMIEAFEKLPEDKRKKTIDESMKRMREARENGEFNASSNGPGAPGSRGTNGPALSPELQKRMAEIGLKTFYKESSAQMKAEVAPLLEEIQKNMESGRPFRGDRH